MKDLLRKIELLASSKDFKSCAVEGTIERSLVFHNCAAGVVVVEQFVETDFSTLIETKIENLLYLKLIKPEVINSLVEIKEKGYYRIDESPLTYKSGYAFFKNRQFSCVAQLMEDNSTIIKVTDILNIALPELSETNTGTEILS